MADFDRDDVEVIDSRSAWRGFFEIRALKLRHRLFAGGWGKPISRELFVRGPAVGLLPYDARRDEVLLVEQFRVGALDSGQSPWLTELVAGIIDTDESPEDVARREAREEADIAVAELEAVAEYFSSPGGSDEYFYLYCGQCSLDGAGGLHGLATEGEDIRASVYAAETAFAMLDRGEINNAHSVIALQWLRLHRARLQAQWS
ncbi:MULTISPECIES: NUDIX domain-containing protein [Spongiibacter]|uniref:NUDIX domain-containing protein n=1 Tax=Spongiibacter TaxID=630749 RepID=UPI0003B413A3|nr:MULTISPECIES: NUDIX domain-containing protein [Spongiibacter]MBO6753554.1 NUDIX domain-containing protein [Spongiibacter sp.]|tara:strand:- start:17095 stop:17703 length:609 start_codon:yes stop_codon:yes gene_type:complete